MSKENIVELLIKIGIPSAIGVSIKLGMQAQKQRITICRVVLSFMIGSGSSYLVYPLIHKNASEDLVPLFIAMFYISSKTIAEYIIYKWNIDYFIGSIIEAFRQLLINLINPKK